MRSCLNLARYSKEFPGTGKTHKNPVTLFPFWFTDQSILGLTDSRQGQEVPSSQENSHGNLISSRISCMRTSHGFLNAFSNSWQGDNWTSGVKSVRESFLKIQRHSNERWEILIFELHDLKDKDWMSHSSRSLRTVLQEVYQRQREHREEGSVWEVFGRNPCHLNLFIKCLSVEGYQWTKRRMSLPHKWFKRAKRERIPTRKEKCNPRFIDSTITSRRRFRQHNISVKLDRNFLFLLLEGKEPEDEWPPFLCRSSVSSLHIVHCTACVSCKEFLQQTNEGTQRPLSLSLSSCDILLLFYSKKHQRK